MKKSSLILVILSILINLFGIQVYAESTTDNFSVLNKYFDEQFLDVSETDWFYSNVKLAYELGLMKGTSDNTFNPDGNISIAETVVLACRLHSIYYTGKAEFDTGDPWFQPYVDYAVQNGIIGNMQYKNFEAYATRAQFATILAAVFPDAEFVPINNVKKGEIPDVSSFSQYSDAVYKLYNAGILTGNDEKGTFSPQSNIQRSAVAAIATRMTDVKLRQKVNLKENVQYKPEVKESDSGENKPLTPEQISGKCADAVFYIECYAFNGEFMSTGSGFFISADGLAVTNFHVVANTGYCVIYTNDGISYDGVEIIDYNKERDLALLKVDGEGFSHIKLSNSATLRQGQKVYAIGSPLGLTNTMSEGIVSNPSRDVGGVDFIQISTPIEHGSSGGVLLDEYGVVVGVTSSGMDSNADLNFAVPIKYVNDLNMKGEPLGVVWSDVYYSGFDCVLDFGAFCGADIKHSETTITKCYMVYDMDDFYDVGPYEESDCFAYSTVLYKDALELNGMTTNNNYDDYEVIYKSEFEEVSIRYDSYKREIIIKAETAPVVYEAHSNVPDFGWCSGLSLKKEPGVYEDGCVYTYKWSDHYSRKEFEVILRQYRELLETWGHKLVDFDDPTYFFISNGEFNVYYKIEGNEFWLGTIKNDFI